MTAEAQRRGDTACDTRTWPRRRTRTQVWSGSGRVYLPSEPIGLLCTEERRVESRESAAIRYQSKIDHARQVERVLQ